MSPQQTNFHLEFPTLLFSKAEFAEQTREGESRAAAQQNSVHEMEAALDLLAAENEELRTRLADSERKIKKVEASKLQAIKSIAGLQREVHGVVQEADAIHAASVIGGGGGD